MGSLAELERMVGVPFASGAAEWERWENWLLTDCTAADPELADDGMAHPVALFPLSLRAAGVTIASLFERRFWVLGLRAGEIVALTLEDVDWELSALTVHGKGDRREALPLPEDVGDALVSYLRRDRPRCTSRRVFIRQRAPHQGFATSAAICDVVRRALERTGLDPAFKGAHLLRHSLATNMLHGGASLREIGDILRHCRPETTQIYAKVDIGALRALAPPWPGGAS